MLAVAVWCQQCPLHAGDDTYGPHYVSTSTGAGRFNRSFAIRSRAWLLDHEVDEVCPLGGSLFSWQTPTGAEFCQHPSGAESYYARRGQGRANALVLLADHRSVCPRGPSQDDPDGVDRLGIAC
jgi:hypothetical protein